MIETATQEELTSYLGYEKNKKSNIDNYRNGYSKKNLKSKYEEIELQNSHLYDNFYVCKNIKN